MKKRDASDSHAVMLEPGDVPRIGRSKVGKKQVVDRKCCSYITGTTSSIEPATDYSVVK